MWRKVMPRTGNLSEIKVSDRNGRAFLSSLIRKIEERIYAECLTEDKVSVSVRYGAGTIEVLVSSDGTNEVAVCHDNGHESPTMESTIAGMIPDWWAIHDMAVVVDAQEKEFEDYLWRNCRFM